VTVLANPELVRNARAHLRGDRMLVIGVICGVLSLVVGFALAHTAGDAGQPQRWGRELLRIAVYAQALVLLLVGGLGCAHAIQREKERNTFDFQRVTRLAPLELTLGKLFGAPIQAYFVALCLVPAALVGAVAGGARPSLVLAGFLVLILGAIAFHAFTLVISLLAERDAAVSLAVLGILILGGLPTSGSALLLHLGPLSPFVAATVVGQTSWALGAADAPVLGPRGPASGMTDVFFGLPVHHVPVLVVVYLTFTGWCLLAVARNIKRDPAVYETLTPWQAFGFALYVNVVLLGFFRWSFWSPLAAQGVLLGVNTALFFALGLALVRTRDSVRRLRAHGFGAIAAAWPAPYVVAGMLVAAVVPVVNVHLAGVFGAPSDLGLAVFRVALCTAWVARDVLYLQWMTLRGGGRPLLLGVLYLSVVYACVGILFGTLRLFATPQGLALTAVVAPGAAFALDASSWADTLGMWMVVLLAQVVGAGLLVARQRRALEELAARPGAGAAA